MAKPDAKEASTRRDKFIETALKLGADEDQAAFVEKLKKIPKAPPKKRVDGQCDMARPC